MSPPSESELRSAGFLKGFSTPGSASSDVGSSHSNPPALSRVLEYLLLDVGWCILDVKCIGVKESVEPRRRARRRVGESRDMVDVFFFVKKS